MTQNWFNHGGDPTRTAWIVVLLYVGGVLASAVAARRAQGRERQFWILAAIVLALLGLNKQLDLQTWLTAHLRTLARAQGWYPDRRAMQRLFLAGLGSAGLTAWLGMLVWQARARGTVKLALAGGTLLLCFIVARAASFYHLKGALGGRLLGMRVHQLIEAAGILIVIAAALAYRRIPSRR